MRGASPVVAVAEVHIAGREVLGDLDEERDLHEVSSILEHASNVAYMGSRLDNNDASMCEAEIMKYYGRCVGAVRASEDDADRELPDTWPHHDSNDVDLGVPKALEQLRTAPPLKNFQERQFVFWTSVARRLLVLYVVRPLGMRDAGDPGAQLFGAKVVDLIDQYYFVPTSVPASLFYIKNQTGHFLLSEPFYIDKPESRYRRPR
jgi:hypothetical protein